MVALLRGFAEQFRALVPYSWIKCMDLRRSVLTQLTFYQRSVIRSALEQMLGIVDGAGDGEVHASLERKGVVDGIDAHVCMEASRKSKIVGVPGRLIIDRKTLYKVRFEMNSQYANYACITFEFT